MKRAKYFRMAEDKLTQLYQDWFKLCSNWENKEVAELLDRSELKDLNEAVENNIINRQDLIRINGYMDFIVKNKINKTKCEIELRIEKSPTISSPERQFAYVLIPPDCSFTRKLEKSFYLLWWHDYQWAFERFLNPSKGPYLCGQDRGISKFASLIKASDKIMKSSITKEIRREINQMFGLQTSSKEEILRVFGLSDYEWFESTPELYFIAVQCTKNILHMTNPKVPLIYKVCYKNKWENQQHFGEQAIPGYTAGGFSEVVISSFEIDGIIKQFLDPSGVLIDNTLSCRRFWPVSD
jgi:hypothetical protein